MVVICCTCVSAFSTFILCVEMKRSTSVMGWDSPSGACQLKPTSISQKTYLEKALKYVLDHKSKECQDREQPND